MADLDLDAIERVASRSVGFDHSAVICALVAEVRRLRDLLARALPHIDPNDNQDAYQLLIECKEATKETP